MARLLEPALTWIKVFGRNRDHNVFVPQTVACAETSMVTNADHLHPLLTLQRALERSLDSDWLRGSTAGMGSFPPINIFQQGDDFVAIAELPGVSRNAIEIQVQDRVIR